MDSAAQAFAFLKIRRKRLLLVERNLSLKMPFVPFHLNQADWFSRRLSPLDAMFSWEIVQRSNVQRDWRGNPLKHFTPYPTTGSSGVNVFNQDLGL